MQEKQDKIRQWNNLIKQYIAQHKYLEDIGRMWIKKGGSNEDVQNHLKEALVKTDKSWYQLKTFFVPFLDTTGLFVEDELKHEVKKLAEEKCILMVENANLKEAVENLQQNIDTNEYAVNDNFELILKQKEEQFHDMLKTQNDLIGDLKAQLMQSNKEVEMFRMLNKDLEIKLNKSAIIYEDDQFTKKFPTVNSMQ